MSVLAIHLGDSNCNVGYMHNKEPKIVKEFDSVRIASCVKCNLKGVLCGELARNSLSNEYAEVIVEMKYMFGCQPPQYYKDQFNQEELCYPYYVRGGLPKYITKAGKFKHNDYNQLFVQRILIRHLRDLATDTTGLAFDHLVLSVPAHYNKKERNIAMQAAVDVGFANQSITMINDPVAAIFAYSLQNYYDKAALMMVVNFGESKLELSILRVDQGLCEVIVNDTDYNVSGDAIDRTMLNYIISRGQIDDSGEEQECDLTESMERKLIWECRQMKYALNKNFTQEITIPSENTNKNLQLKITRSTFETISACLIKALMKNIIRLMKSSGIKKTSIKQVILAGGSSCIPTVQSILQDFFGSERICMSIAMEKVIIEGAIKCTEWINHEFAHIKPKLTLPISIGIGQDDGIQKRVLLREAKIPTAGCQIVHTRTNADSQFCINIYQGERQLYENNIFVQRLEFSFDGASPFKKISVSVTIGINDDNELQVIPTVNGFPTNPENYSIPRGKLYMFVTDGEHSWIEAKRNCSRDKFKYRKQLLLSDYYTRVADFEELIRANKKDSPVTSSLLKKCEHFRGWLSTHEHCTEFDWSWKMDQLESSLPSSIVKHPAPGHLAFKRVICCCCLK